MDNIHRLTPAEDIEQQAADWLVRLDGDRAPSATELDELKAWMQRSPAHKEQLQTPNPVLAQGQPAHRTVLSTARQQTPQWPARQPALPI